MPSHFGIIPHLWTIAWLMEIMILRTFQSFPVKNSYITKRNCWPVSCFCPRCPFIWLLLILSFVLYNPLISSQRRESLLIWLLFLFFYEITKILLAPVFTWVLYTQNWKCFWGRLTNVFRNRNLSGGKKNRLRLGDLNNSPLDLRFVIQVISSRIYSPIDYEG